MQVEVSLLPFGIAELFAEVNKSGKITLADRYGLMAALLEDTLAEEDKNAIDRILYSVRKGRLKVVNELSAMI